MTELTPFTTYSLEVAAVNDGGTGQYSTPLTVETMQDGELVKFENAVTYIIAYSFCLSEIAIVYIIMAISIMC